MAVIIKVSARAVPLSAEPGAEASCRGATPTAPPCKSTKAAATPASAAAAAASGPALLARDLGLA